MDHSHHHHATEGIDATMERCWMSMLWNTNIINTCVVFRQWHIHSYFQFYLSFLAVVALGCSYEWLRDLQRRVDRRIAAQLISSGKGKSAVSHHRTSAPGIALEDDTQEEALLIALKGDQSMEVPLTSRLLRASLYGASVFVSFFLMLVFMTYNAYLILATVIGAALGHFIYGSRMDPDAILGAGIAPRGMSCH
ncbi:related to a putative low-affinity copper transport protein [Serendipita indica DSM 11827]|uniref:Copper transport protein n=1 Tax=Serendipita indica (strain DSM 11827) TaxID=1109443 RepID=G4T8D9_SERID|nr:related to a putative low-affinity copper transport protein [Serendipita indica DSM 11827]